MTPSFSKIPMPRWPLRVAVALAAALGVALAACAPPAPAVSLANAVTPPPRAVASCDPAKDRAAIVQMAGTFKVTFDFQETEPLATGYVPKEPYRTGATEVVTVLDGESTATHVVMQHILVLGSGDRAMLTKHWRQDWTFEDPEIVVFRGARTWERTPVLAEARTCAWTQAVFEVDDAPRYESYGTWKHDGETSTWTSRETWRPLPRREYTKRSDYDVLVGTNVHVVTKDGWRHEQANTKLVLATMRPLVREKGLNTYVRTEGSATEIAAKYLRETGPFWSAVRREWARIVADYPRFTIDAEQGGEPLYERLFPMADAAAKEPASQAWQRAVATTVRAYVRPAVARAATDSRAASN